MAPTGKAYHQDWIMGTGSNVHVANNIAWFTPESFVPFESSVEAGGPKPADVQGIGTVKLPVVTPDHNDGSNPLILHDVLFAPSFMCNLVGAPVMSEYGLQIGPEGGKLFDDEKETVAILDYKKLWRFRLVGHDPTETSLGVGGIFMIRAWWPDAERKRWEEFKGKLEK